ncbi:hypothetical protein GYB22_08815 [bacterium]|nr:hypothetical protein [bacterium]
MKIKTYTPLFIFFLVLAVFSSCKNEDDTPEFEGTINGKLVDDCSGNPVSNVTLSLWEAHDTMIFTKFDPSFEKISEAVTNASGEFSLKINSSDISQRLFIVKGTEVLAYGDYKISEAQPNVEIGSIYEKPLTRPARFILTRNEAWVPGDYVVISNWNRDSEYIRDTFTTQNSTMSGSDMIVDTEVSFIYKYYWKDTARTAMSGRTSIAYKTQNCKDVSSIGLSSSECDTAVYEIIDDW